MAGMNQTKAWALSILVSSSIVGGLVGLMLYDAKKALNAKKIDGTIVVSDTDSKSLKVSSFETPADEISSEVEGKKQDNSSD